MNTTIAKQIEPYSGNSHIDTYVVGTKIHLNPVLWVQQRMIRFMLKYNRQNKVADFLLAGK